MFREESWKFIYFRIKRSKVKVTSHKNSGGVGLWTHVSVGLYGLVTMHPVYNAFVGCSLLDRILGMSCRLSVTALSMLFL